MPGRREGAPAEQVGHRHGHPSWAAARSPARSRRSSSETSATPTLPADPAQAGVHVRAAHVQLRRRRAHRRSGGDGLEQHSLLGGELAVDRGQRVRAPPGSRRRAATEGARAGSAARRGPAVGRALRPPAHGEPSRHELRRAGSLGMGSADQLVGQAHAVEPLARVADLGEGREPAAPRHTGSSASGPPPRRSTSAMNDSPWAYWLILASRPSRRCTALAAGAGVGPALPQHPGEAVGARDAVGAGPVHRDVAVALEQAHEPADLVEHHPLVRCGEQGGEPAVVERAARPAAGRRRPSPSASRNRFGSGSTESSVCWTRPR